MIRCFTGFRRVAEGAMRALMITASSFPIGDRQVKDLRFVRTMKADDYKAQ